MRSKRLIGSHFANYREAWEANRLVSKGMIQPVLSRVFPLAQAGEAAYQVHHNTHEGKIGVLALAPEEGLGVTDHELRGRVADQLNWFRRG
jgi:crotonyl-CoA reductase